MKTSSATVRSLLVLGLLLVSQKHGSAQLPVAELHSINPPVIVPGQTTEVTVAGVQLDNLTGLVFSNPSIKGEPVLLPKSEYWKYPRQNGLRFKVTVPADLPPQTVEARTAGFFGLSTPCPFVIAPTGSKILADSAGAAHHKIETAPPLPREALAHGTTDANQVDWWKFSVNKGERLVIQCRGEQINSQADPTMSVVDGRGYELEKNRDTVGRDPLIDFTAPADGDYWVGVYDFFYNGGANFRYVLQVTARPWIDAVFPPAGKPGQSYRATLYGRNLPGGSPGENLKINGKSIETLQVMIQVPAAAPGAQFQWEDPARAILPGFPFQQAGSNTVKIGFSDQEVTAVDIDKTPPPLAPPFEIASRFDEPGDIDPFRFVAKKGTTYWVEVVGDRLAGNSDPYLVIEKVTKADDGTESFTKVRDGDDGASRGGITFRESSRDTTLSFAADQDGEYQVTVINQFASGGPEKIYRLAVREAKPDFEIIAVGERSYTEARQAFPAAPFLRKGGTFPLRLLVNRKDGFKENITIQASGLPPGVTCPPITITEKETTPRLIFSAAADAPAWHGMIKLNAIAKLGDAEKTYPVRMGALVRGVTDYNTARLRTRLELGIPLAISEHEPAPAFIEVGNGGKFSVTMGEKLEIPFKVNSKNPRKGNLAVSAVGLRGLTKPPVIQVADKAKDGKLALTFKAARGTFAPEVGTWTFVLKGTGVVPYQHNLKASERAEEEKKHIEELAKKYTEAATKAKTDLAAKKKALDDLKKNLAAATAEAKPGLDKSVAEATAAFQAAEKLQAQSEAKRLEAEKEKAAIIKLAAARKKTATTKDTKFATWSLPVTVEVKPAPEKPAPKKS